MMDIYRTFAQEMFHYKGGSMRYEQREGAKLWREKHHSNLLTKVMTNLKFITLVLSSAAVINSCSSNLIFPAGRKEASKMMVIYLFLNYRYFNFKEIFSNVKIPRKHGIKKDY